jgi:hypothetical protein
MSAYHVAPCFAGICCCCKLLRFAAPAICWNLLLLQFAGIFFQKFAGALLLEFAATRNCCCYNLLLLQFAAVANIYF